MKITTIKQQQKRPDRYSVYVDEKFAFGLGELDLINSGLRKGQELSQAELAKLKDTSAQGKAYDRALQYVALRPRSEREMGDYLRRKQYEPELIELIISRLKDRRYLNDEQFARMWVENRRLLKATSKRKLRLELKVKGMTDDIIASTLAEDEVTDREVLRELVERKRRQTKYQDDLKLMQHLARQGYNYNDIRAVLKKEED